MDWKTIQPQDYRKVRGQLIAQTSRIQKDDKGNWKVPSQSGHGVYVVKSNGFGATCNCKDHQDRGCKCKHIWAVELIVTQQVDSEGNITITQTKRITYKQDWHNYNLAQTKEKELFMKLLADLTEKIQNSPYTFGRPTNQLGDTIYSMVFKVYSTFSSRRFTTDMEIAKSQGYLKKHRRELKIIWLPTGCPEMNPIEECWNQAKGEVNGGRIHKSFEVMKKELRHFLKYNNFKQDMGKYLRPWL